MPNCKEQNLQNLEIKSFRDNKIGSSAFHTIVSHADFKDCIRTPYHIDGNGNIVDEDFIETYFDIENKLLVSLKSDFKNKLTYLNAGTSYRIMPKTISREDLSL